jgi:hypothetical protein
METKQYTNREFMIFNVSELDKIDFNKVCETSAATVRKSIDGNKTFVKWDGEMPTCIVDLTTGEGPYTYSEILEIMNTSEWTDYNPIEGEII